MATQQEPWTEWSDAPRPQTSSNRSVSKPPWTREATRSTRVASVTRESRTALAVGSFPALRPVKMDRGEQTVCGQLPLAFRAAWKRAFAFRNTLVARPADAPPTAASAPLFPRFPAAFLVRLSHFVMQSKTLPAQTTRGCARFFVELSAVMKR